MNLPLAGWEGPAGEAERGRLRAAIGTRPRLTVLRSHGSLILADEALDPPADDLRHLLPRAREHQSMEVSIHWEPPDGSQISRLLDGDVRSFGVHRNKGIDLGDTLVGGQCCPAVIRALLKLLRSNTRGSDPVPDPVGDGR